MAQKANVKVNSSKKVQKQVFFEKKLYFRKKNSVSLNREKLKCFSQQKLSKKENFEKEIVKKMI